MFGIMKDKPTIPQQPQAAAREPEPAKTAGPLYEGVSMIRRAEDIPSHTSCLSVLGGLVKLSTADRKIVAVLEVAKNKAIVLWTGVPEDKQARDSAQSRARNAGIDVVEFCAATKEIIAFCHDREAQAGLDGPGRTDDLEVSEATTQFDLILMEAFRMKATDIHVLIDERSALVRFRINGWLRDFRPMLRANAESMLRAMYTQCDEGSRSGSANFDMGTFLDASLTRLISIEARACEVKMRWASGPSVGGGHDLVLRILARESGIRPLKTLGWRKEQVEAMNDALKRPEGIILVVGVTGSGKSTTLAASAYEWLERYHGKRSLRTIEDPVEILIPGARHMPVNSTGEEEALSGSGFGRALRAALRMDPDGIYIGEVRDEVTAELTMQAQKTGHKVFGTLHASSSFEAYSRLEDLGLLRKKLMTESAVNLIAYQRLIPIICNHCSIPYAEAKDTIPQHVRDIVEDDFSSHLEEIRFRGKGCKHCGIGSSNGDGAIGRQALVHLLIPDATFRHLMTEGHDMLAEAYWRGGISQKNGKIHGMTLHDSARALIRAGSVCPVDVDMELGGLREEMPPHEARAWYAKQIEVTSNAGAIRGR